LLILEHRKNKIKWKDIALELGRSSQSCKTRMRDLKKRINNGSKINNIYTRNCNK